MLAQAQRCFYERALLDALSPKLLSRISAQLASYYADVLAAVRSPPLKGHVADVRGVRRRTRANGRLRSEGVARGSARREQGRG